MKIFHGVQTGNVPERSLKLSIRKASFLLDRIESRPRLKVFLKDIRNQSPAWLQLVAYALKTKSRPFY
jgi:hypothetical protein